ncbi:MAG: Bax inhibitor-1/YccA family protein [Bacilli bacterium]|nr:Bax inhibitor-1/YccA family protein [Bacilli bacterium]
MENNFLSNVFKWLFIGLLITFASGYILYSSTTLLTLIFGYKLYIVAAILEIVIAIILSSRINNMSKTSAIICYSSYAILTGITLASIFVVFSISSIIYIFLATSLVFGIFAFIGKTTNIDLSKLSTYLVVGLVSVIILQIINMFLLNNSLNMISCIISLIVFIGFTAYDIQKITRYYHGNDNLAIYGAFELYLDFINIFIDLINLFGKEK